MLAEALFAPFVPEPTRAGMRCVAQHSTEAAPAAMPPVAREMLRHGGHHVVCASALTADDAIAGADLWVVDATEDVRNDTVAAHLRITPSRGGEVCTSELFVERW